MSDADRSQPSDWSPASFGRDTLVYFWGSLSSTVMKAAFADPTVVEAYKHWIARAQRSPELSNQGEALLEAGMAGGQLTLIARAVPGQFCIQCHHPAFEVVAAMGFDAQLRILTGLFIARFEGRIADASRFAFDLDRLISSGSATDVNPAWASSAQPPN